MGLELRLLSESYFRSILRFCMTKGPSLKGQLELGIQRHPAKDRNHHLGGRSFYFFDLDDNIAFPSTPLILFHKATGAEYAVTSGEYAKIHPYIGVSGPYADYEVRLDDETGTY